MQNLTLFCRNCAEFLSPGEAACSCGTRRAPAEVVTANGEPLWKAASPGQPAGYLCVTSSHLAFGLNDRWSGKVVLINRENGSLFPPFTMHNPISGGIIAGDEAIFGVTRGLAGYDGTAQLFCLDYTQPGGFAQRWPAPLRLPDNPASQPVLLRGVVYVLCCNGRITLAGSRTGEEHAMLAPDLSSPARWLKTYGERLLVACENGEIRFIQPETGRVYHKPAYALGFSSMRAPEVFGDWLCATDEDYQSRVMDLRTGRVIALPLGVSTLLAEPFIDSDRLYVGGSDHVLHAIDLLSGAQVWSSKVQRHSIAARPVTGMGLVAAAVNQVGVLAFDPQKGEEVWQFPIPGRPQTFAPLAFDDGVFYAATDKGATYAIPWHGSSYLAASQWLEQQGDIASAGTAAALANLMLPEKSPAMLNRALELWRGSGKFEWAARLGEKLLDTSDESIAADFEQAASLMMDRDKQLLLLRRAEKWYEDANNRTGVGRVRKKAARIRAPYVRIQAVSIPQEFESGTNNLLCVITLENRGTDTAYKVWVRSGGNCSNQRFWMDLQSYLPNGIVINEIPVEIEFPVALTCSGSLEVLVRCEDSTGKRWEFHEEFPIHVKSFDGVEIFGDVGLLNAPEGKVRIHGMVGMVKMRPEGG